MAKKKGTRPQTSNAMYRKLEKYVLNLELRIWASNIQYFTEEAC
jgi:hypothetical protein